MTENQPTTDRARRQQAVETGAAESAVERVTPRTDPRGDGRGSTSRQRQQRAARDVAGQIGIGRSGVGTVDRLSGLDVFLRSSGTDQFADTLRSDFASEADFVEPSDVAADVDPEEITGSAEVARDRRDDVAARAREQTARETDFVEPADVAADVGPVGVTGLGIASGRRDDVATRTRQQLAADSPFTRPGDFDVTVSDRGVESASLTESGQRSAAARQFESETMLSDVEPGSDITETGDGFGLTTDAQRELGALRIDEQTPDVSVTPDDVTLEDGQAVFEREVTR